MEAMGLLDRVKRAGGRFFSAARLDAEAGPAPLLAYAAVLFVLLMGSGLVRIPSGSSWFPVIKYGIAATVLALGLRGAITAKKCDRPPVLYLMLALFVPFTIDFHLHHAFILLTLVLFAGKSFLPFNSALKPVYVLFIWGAISFLVNQFVEFNPLSFPLFTATFFLPFVFLGLFQRYAAGRIGAKLLDFYHALLLIMVLVIGLQVVFLWHLHPDMRTGGTRMTTHAAMLLGIAFLGLLFKKRAGPGFFSGYGGKEKALLILTLPVLFIIDAKYVLVFLLFSAFVSAVFFGLNSRRVRAAVLLFTAALAALWFVFTDGLLPLSELAVRTKRYNLVGVSRQFSTSAKARLIRSAAALPANDPLVFFIGSGPGTFLSRAASSRTPARRGRAYGSYGWQRKFAESYLPGFILPYESWIRKKYWQDGLVDPQLGSLYNWNSSLFNMVFETGIVGVLLFAWFFLKLARRAVLARGGETGVFSRLAVIALALFLFLMSLNELWYEQPTFQIAAFALIGLTLARREP
jgi:hypothetical protein